MKLCALLLLLAGASSGATVVRLACGGPGGVDSSGNTWAPDSGFSGGASWVNTPPAGLVPPYLNLRYSGGTVPFSYTFTLPAGAYVLTLKFIEPNKAAAGLRVFSVTANGAAVVSGLDVFAKAGGPLKPYDVSAPVTVDGVTLKLTFTATVGNAVIAGIQIDTVPPPPPPPSVAMASQLGDMQVTRTSDTVLTIGANCSDVTPCNVLLGSITTSFTHPLTVTVADGNGTAAIYVDGISRIPVAVSDTLSLSCSGGCLTAIGTTFPYGSVALAQWPASNGRWDPVGHDLRSFMGHPINWIEGGAGIQVTDTNAGDVITISLAPSLVSAFSWLSPLNPTGGPVLAGSSFTLGTAAHKVTGPCTVLSVTLFSVTFDAVTPKWKYDPVTCDVTIGPAAADLGDFRVSIVLSLGGPQLLALDRCTGAGAGWDCGGLIRASVKTADGTVLRVYGTSMDDPAAPNPLAVWSPVR
jgi:hypothetical protein